MPSATARQLRQTNFRRDVGTLYLDHHSWLYGWLRRKLGNAHQAADLAHDTFVRLLTKSDAVMVPELHEPRAFLTTLAQGIVSNFYRRQRLERAWLETLASLPEPMTGSPEAQAIMLEALVEIDRLLDSLPALVRQAFLLSQLDGLPQAEIAARLGISVPTVKRHIAKALVLCAFAQELQA